MMGRLVGWLGSPLLLALLAAALYWLAWMNGNQYGQQRCAENALASVQQQLADYSAALTKAEAASLAHLEQLHQAEKNHEQSTRTLRRALSETASVRADCRLAAGLMQQLAAAREAAARAATGSAGTALPAAGGTGR